MQPNHLGTLCTMGLGAAIIIWSRNNWSWLSGIIGVILLTLIAGLTGSRSTLLNIIIFAGASYFFIDAKNHKIIFLYTLTSLAIFTLTIFFAKNFYDALLLSNSNNISIIDRGTSSAGRTALWAQAIQAIKLEPWTGFGWRQIPASQILVSHIYPGIYATIYYHNFFLDLLVENGIIFSLCYLILFFLWIKQFKLSKNKIFLLIPLALIIPSLTEYQFSYTYLLLPAVLCLSIAIEPRQSHKADYYSNTKINLSQHIAPIVFGILSIFIFIDYIKCEGTFISTRLKANGIASHQANIKAPNVFILDDLALLSAIYSLDKNEYTQNDLEKLKYLSARFPYIVIKGYYIKALIQLKDTEHAKIIYKGVMNCYGENAKNYLNSFINANPSLHVIKQ
ncbi:MAG: O-antigen ligase family protein [Brachymonas sp.]